MDSTISCSVRESFIGMVSLVLQYRLCRWIRTRSSVRDGAEEDVIFAVVLSCDMEIESVVESRKNLGSEFMAERLVWDRYSVDSI